MRAGRPGNRSNDPHVTPCLVPPVQSIRTVPYHPYMYSLATFWGQNGFFVSDVFSQCKSKRLNVPHIGAFPLCSGMLPTVLVGQEGGIRLASIVQYALASMHAHGDLLHAPTGASVPCPVL